MKTFGCTGRWLQIQLTSDTAAWARMTRESGKSAASSRACLPSAGIPRPAWIRTGSLRSCANVKTSRTASSSIPKPSARGCSLMPRAPSSKQREASATGSSCGSSRQNGTRRPFDAAAHAKDGVVGIAISVGLLHREDDSLGLKGGEQREELLVRAARPVRIVAADVRVGVEEREPGKVGQQRCEPVRDQGGIVRLVHRASLSAGSLKHRVGCREARRRRPGGWCACLSSRHMSAIEASRAGANLRRRHTRGRRGRPRGRGRRDLRVPGPERRREDHHGAHAHHAASPDRRRRAGRRARRRHGGRRGAARDRRGAPGGRARPADDRPGADPPPGDAPRAAAQAKGNAGPTPCSSASGWRTRRTAGSAPTRAACAAASTSPRRSCTSPEVLFLDEPTTGLDPVSRRTIWEEVEKLNDEGTTVFLTTQYLEEADKLADRVGIIDAGQHRRRGHAGAAEGGDRAAPPRGEAR